MRLLNQWKTSDLNSLTSQNRQFQCGYTYCYGPIKKLKNSDISLFRSENYGYYRIIWQREHKSACTTIACFCPKDTWSLSCLLYVLQQTLNDPPTSLIQESQVSVVAALEISASMSRGRTQAGFPKPHNSTQLVKRTGPCDVLRLVLGAVGDKRSEFLLSLLSACTF